MTHLPKIEADIWCRFMAPLSGTCDRDLCYS